MLLRGADMTAGTAGAESSSSLLLLLSYCSSITLSLPSVVSRNRSRDVALTYQKAGNRCLYDVMKHILDIFG